MDPAFKRVLMYLLVGSKGGPNRLQMIKLLKEEPMNANKMGERLGLDYKTVQHHLKILKENNVVVTSAGRELRRHVLPDALHGEEPPRGRGDMGEIREKIDI